jgi:hypothetical protein
VLDVYSALDAGLARLLREAGPETTSAILFSHGMGPNYHGDHLFGELLGRFNRAWSGEPAEAAGPAPPGAFERLWRGTVGRIPPSWRDRIKRRLPLSLRIGITLSRVQDAAAWARSPSFALPMRDGFSAVRVNLVGREPQGRIHPGAEYRDHLDALESVLLRLTNAETGGRAVERLMRADRIVDPVSLGSGADLTVWWSKSAPLRSVLSPELGTVTAPTTAAASTSCAGCSSFPIRGRAPVAAASTACKRRTSRRPFASWAECCPGRRSAAPAASPGC